MALLCQFIALGTTDARVARRRHAKYVFVALDDARWLMLQCRQDGETCPACGGEVEKIKVSGRSGYYCPHCQER